MRDKSEKNEKMLRAILEHFLEDGAAATREDIAKRCGVSPTTVGKWLGECGGVPNGCKLEMRSRRGGGGGPGKEHFYPRIHTLRQVIIEERQEAASLRAG